MDSWQGWLNMLSLGSSKCMCRSEEFSGAGRMRHRSAHLPWLARLCADLCHVDSPEHLGHGDTVGGCSHLRRPPCSRIDKRRTGPIERPHPCKPANWGAVLRSDSVCIVCWLEAARTCVPVAVWLWWCEVGHGHEGRGAGQQVGGHMHKAVLAPEQRHLEGQARRIAAWGWATLVGLRVFRGPAHHLGTPTLDRGHEYFFLSPMADDEGGRLSGTWQMTVMSSSRSPTRPLCCCPVGLPSSAALALACSITLHPPRSTSGQCCTGGQW